MPWDRRRYPADWEERRARILERAGHRCEMCDVPNHAVGHRDGEGAFVPLGGSGPCDAAGCGRSWPDTHRQLTYAQARGFAQSCNDHAGGRADADGRRWFVVVLTIAHLVEGELDCPDEHLDALCQRCHNRLDAPMRRRNAARTRDGKKAIGDLFAE